MSLKHSEVKFKFEDFESLPSEQGVRVTSKQVTDSHGNIWKMVIYPGGRNGEDYTSSDGMVHMTLFNTGNKDVSARPTFIVRGVSGEVYTECTVDVQKFKEGGTGWGCDIIERSEIIDKENNILLDGALLVDVHIQLQPEPKSLTVPPSPLSTNMLKLLYDSESADVKFKVKRTVITAHKCILKANAPILYDFCKGCKEGEKIKIDNISPAIFKIILRHVYGGEIPGKDTIMCDIGNDCIGKDIIDAADRFGIVSLKLAVETALVGNFRLDKENFAGWLLFAESKTCPLIKEAAIAFFVARSKDLLQSEGWEALSESPKLMSELMKEMSKRIKIDTRFSGRGESMSVIELRKKLGEKGLDLDGSKEILVSRLEESNKRQRTE